jgi:two-component system sensor histidine kinase BaeS
MRNSTIVVWTSALLSSALGAAFLFSAEPGINWPIWVAAVSLSVVIARLVTRGRVESPLAILLSWATLLSFGFALSDNDFIHALVVLSDAMLLGLAIISVGAESWSTLSAKLLAAVPFLAPFRVWRATAYQVADAPHTISSSRSRSLIKGALLSAPLIIVLIVLLGSADPVIQWGTDRISALLPDWSFPSRLLFFFFLLSITLGANSISSRQIEPALPNIRGLEKTSTIGLTEQRMMLWSATAVLWLFVLLQVSYFIQPPPVTVDSGVTFAEYARRGFGELSFAATIVGAMILLLEYARPSTTGERERRMMVRLEIALLVALELILFSAFRRVILYEQAYGFTTARLFAQAYMIVMSLVLIALGLEVARGGISIAFGRRVAEIALGVFTVLVFWNFEAWIVNRNVDRAAQTGKFDLEYARRLSGDAIPTLISRRRELGPTNAANVEGSVHCAAGTTERRWFEWNRGADATREAFRSVHPQPCPAGQALRWSRYSD